MRKFDLKVLLLLSLGHCMTDIYQGALPAILPFLKTKFGITYAMAGLIIFASNFTSSIIQPFFGLLSDREEKPLLLWAGCLVAGIGFSLLPLSPNYAMVLLLVTISGLGVAAYHPEGFKTASYFTGLRPATGMSIFSAGGNLGFALGPIVAVSIVKHWGFSSLSLMVVFSLLFISTLAVKWKGLARRKAAMAQEHKPAKIAGKIVSNALVILIGTVILRSAIVAGLMTYIPFYYIDHLKGDPVYAGSLVFFFLLGGALGTLLGAPIADRLGHKRYLSFSMLLASVIFPLILITGGALLSLVLGLFGMVLISTFTVTIVMAQRLLPGNLGMASGLMVGFAIGTGGAGVTVLGIIADHWGVPAALQLIGILPVAGFILSLFLRYPTVQLHK